MMGLDQNRAGGIVRTAGFVPPLAPNVGEEVESFGWPAIFNMGYT